MDFIFTIPENSSSQSKAETHTYHIGSGCMRGSALEKWISGGLSELLAWIAVHKLLKNQYRATAVKLCIQRCNFFECSQFLKLADIFLCSMAWERAKVPSESPAFTSNVQYSCAHF